MTTGTTDGKVTTAAGGPDGMPLVLPLSEVVRPHFERDAGAYDFDLQRLECAAPEPWSEYENNETGHRWGGFLAGWESALAEWREPTNSQLLWVSPPALASASLGAHMTFDEWWDTTSAAATPETFAGWERSCRQAWEHRDREVRRWRFLAACVVAARLRHGCSPETDETIWELQEALRPNVFSPAS
jgi:hypothetical protein